MIFFFFKQKIRRAKISLETTQKYWSKRVKEMQLETDEMAQSLNWIEFHYQFKFEFLLFLCAYSFNEFLRFYRSNRLKRIQLMLLRFRTFFIGLCSGAHFQAKECMSLLVMSKIKLITCRHRWHTNAPSIAAEHRTAAQTFAHCNIRDIRAKRWQTMRWQQSA